MVKRILLSIVMLALIAYLIVAITAFNRKPADQTCRDMELVIKDTAYAGFITKDELKGILQQKGIYPIGKKMERISTKSLERELSKHPLKKFFRRDQIWFVQKDELGHSELCALSDFKVRSDASFEKDYLAGVYGGIPFLKEFSLKEGE